MLILLLTTLFNLIVGRWRLNRRNIQAHIRELARIRRRIAVLANNRRVPRPRRRWRFIENQMLWENDVLNWPDDKFHSVFRMKPITFNSICRDLGPYLEKQDTRMRNCVPVSKRVAIGIYFMKSGADYSVVGTTFGVGKSTVCCIVEGFVNAMIDRYSNEKIKFPSSLQEQEDMARHFQQRWQFPNCIGSIDGSHIPIIAPMESPEDYYNYKGWYSTILLAVVDFRYRFTYVNAGFPGRVHDAGIFQTCGLQRRIEEGLIFPRFHLIGDGAFPLTQSMMRPFPGINLPDRQQTFNYRLSRARMTVECAFGRLKGRWRVLLKQCDLHFEKTVKVILTCCILHNICEDANELFHEEWLNAVEAFNLQYPHPGDNAVDWEEMSAEEKRNQIIDLLMDMQIPNE